MAIYRLSARTSRCSTSPVAILGYEPEILHVVWKDARGVDIIDTILCGDKVSLYAETRGVDNDTELVFTLTMPDGKEIKETVKVRYDVAEINEYDINKHLPTDCKGEIEIKAEVNEKDSAKRPVKIVYGANLNLAYGFVISGDDMFKNKMLQILESVAKLRVGKKLLCEIFSKLNYNISIKKGKNSMVNGGYKNSITILFNTEETQYSYENGLGHSTLIRTNVTAMVHELEHVRQKLFEEKSIDVFCSDNDPKAVAYISISKYSEVLAIEVENLVRLELGLPERTHYSNVNVYKKTITDKKDLCESIPSSKPERNGKFSLVTNRFGSEHLRHLVYMLTSSSTPNVKFTSNKSYIFKNKSQADTIFFYATQ